MNGLRPPDAPALDLVALSAALDKVSVERPAAIHVMRATDDINATAPSIGAIIDTDPSFAARVMRLANAAFYGMSGRVTNTGFAVTVVGFSAVRSLAAVAAAGLDGDDRPCPEGFWPHSAAAAAGCSAVAHRFGVAAGDAFAAGLLHDLGIALLHGFDPIVHQHLIDRHGFDGAALAAAEAEAFGMGHDAATSRVLSAWRFPEPFVDAIARHHAERPGTDPFARTVWVGDVVARLVDDPDDVELRSLASSLLSDDDVDATIESVGQRADEVMASLRVT